MSSGVCVSCGSTERLEIHHIDRNRNNNDAENLQILCHSCHLEIPRRHNGFGRNLNVAFEDAEFKRLSETKPEGKSWHDWLMELAKK
jgi:5-methylcytosine-specific restriction endonuclease McrA